MKLLFVDGLGANPAAFKPAFLRQQGFEVNHPLLSDYDFQAAVQLACDVRREYMPQVIVGYSRGGAAALAPPDIPLVLLAPAWRTCGVAARIRRSAVVILHSPNDDLVPLDDSRELLRNSGLPKSALIVVGEDHSMIDTPALDALAAAVRQFEHV